MFESLAHVHWIGSTYLPNKMNGHEGTHIHDNERLCFFFGEEVCSIHAHASQRRSLLRVCLQVPVTWSLEEVVQKSSSSISWQVPRFLRELLEFDVDLSE